MTKDELWDLAHKYNFLDESKIKEMVEAHEEKTHIERCVKEFEGNSEILVKSIGYLYLGRLLGHRFLRLTINANVYPKLEKAIQKKYKDECPEIGKLIEKSIGMKIIMSIENWYNNFLDIVRCQKRTALGKDYTKLKKVY